MKLEQQVVSLELSQRLRDLRVWQESLFWWVRWNEERHPNDPEGWQLERYRHEDCENVSAFTVAELGEILWETVEKTKWPWAKTNWNLLYKAYGELFNFRGNPSIGELGIINLMRNPDMMAKIIIYLLENNLITV